MGEPSIDVDARSIEVEETTGAATLSIPVDLPPGPNGLGPDLAIDYSSQAGNGLLGIGWSISLPRVLCSVRFGVPDYSACERFELSGQPLVGPDPNGRFHTFEESFSRIERRAATDAWSVTSTAGLEMRFGETASARVHGPGGVAEWGLSTIEDVFGNRVHFEYATPPDGDEGILQLARVRYANDTREVRFVYESRPDAIRSYRGGVRRAASRRLREIRVYVGPRLHHRLLLRYDTAGATTQSRLVSIQRFGNDCDPHAYPEPTPELCAALPAARFEYNDSAEITPHERWEATGVAQANGVTPPWYAPEMADFGTGSLFARGQTTQFADIDGDGLPDLVVDLPSRHDRPTLMRTNAGHSRSTSPFVFLNDGVDGWEQPTWDGGTRVMPADDGGSVPDNDSARWSDRLASLRFDIASVRVKEVRSGMMGFSSIEDPYLLDAPLFGTCVDPGDPLPAATALPDGGSVQFAGPQGAGWDVPPYFEATAGRNYPLEGPPAWLIPEVDWDTVAESEIRAWPHFQFVDLNTDGRADMVMSVHLSGFHLSLSDCESRQRLDASEATWIPGRTTRVVFLNTGDGWQRDDADDPSDGNYADSLPPFGLVAFESGDLLWSELGWSHPDGPADYDERVASPCDDYGLAGFRTIRPLQYESGSYDFCVTAYDLAPVFQDFDGDGYPDLLVTRTEDIDALLHEYAPDTIRGDAPTVFRTSGGTESVVYLQRPFATGTEPRWVRAPAYDPRYPHALVLQLPGDSAGVNTVTGFSDSFGNVQTFNIDKGVRVADLNGDGLSDILFSPVGVNRGEFGNEGGVFLNRGSPGDPEAAPRYSAWCSSAPVPEVPLCADGGQEAARYTPPVPFAFFDNTYGGDWRTNADGYHFVRATQKGFDLVDLNGDGWVDILTSGWASPVGSGIDHRAFLHQPGAGPSAWREDDRFRPPAQTLFEDVPEGSAEQLLRVGYAVTDVNGDGVADFVGSERRFFPSAQSWISKPDGARSDLLRGYRNGHGLSVSLAYSSALQQRDPMLEQRAIDHAEQLLPDGTGDPGLAEPLVDATTGTPSEYIVSWSRRAVLASRTVSAVGRATATTHYRYAHPRGCPEHRMDLGFRFVTTTRPDGSRVERFAYQHHGRAGRLAEHRVLDEQGRPRHLLREEWEVADPNAVPGGFERAYIGRLRTRVERNEYGETLAEQPGFETRTDWVYDDVHGYNFVQAIRRFVPGRDGFVTIGAAPVDPVHWLVHRPSRRTAYAIDEGGGVRQISNAIFEYEGPSGEYTFDKVGLRRDSTTPRAASAPIEERWTYYRYADNGNLIEERVQLEGRAGGDSRSTHYCYDGEVSAGCPVGQGSRSLRAGVRDALGRWTLQEPHPVFAEPARISSEYQDIPTSLSEFDSLGRVIARRAALPDGSTVLLGETIFVDFPDDGLEHEGVFVPFRVERRFAEDGALRPESAVTSIRVEDGLGGGSMVVDLLGESELAGGATQAIARVMHHDPVARQRVVHDRGACEPVSATGPDRYEAIVAACDAVPPEHFEQTRESLDVLGRPVRVDTPLGGVELASYGAEVVPAGDGADAVPHDRVLRKAANGGLTQTLYADGLPTTIRECNGGPPDPSLTSLAGVGCDAPDVTRLTFEPSGELRERTDPTVPLAGGEGPHRFGARDNQRLAYEYDRLGRIISIHDPDAGTTSFSYDVLGNLVSSVDARGVEIRQAFDALNRPTRIEVDGEVATEVQYATSRLRRVRMIDGDLEKQYSYDALGRLWREIRFVDGFSLIREIDRDLLGRPTRIRYPTVIEGIVDAIGYDYRGTQLVAVCDLGLDDRGCDSATATSIVSGIEYDALGRPTRYSMPGGVRAFEYDRSSLRRVRDAFDSNVGAVEDIEYRIVRAGSSGGPEVPAYDVLGNPERVEAAIGTEPGDPAYVMEYGYDARNRVARFRLDEGSFDYGYDSRGNLTTRLGRAQDFASAETAHAIRWRADEGGEVSHVYDYDVAGRLERVDRVGVGTTRFQFDARGRLICAGRTAGVCDRLRVAYNGEGERVREVGTRTYLHAGPDFRLRPRPDGRQEYWIEIFALGQRVAYKHVTGGGVRIVETIPGLGRWELPLAWRGWLGSPAGVATLLLLTMLGVGVLVSLALVGAPGRATISIVVVGGMALLPVRVWAGGAPANPYRSGTAVYRFLLSDAIGSGLVELDASGQRLSHRTYTPFGEVARATGSNGVGGREMFAGHDRQLDLGLVYMNARWMDPGTGTFLRVDPVVPATVDPQSYNGYAYARNNPVSLVDPLGSDWRIVLTDPETGDVVKKGAWQSGAPPGGLADRVAGLGGQVGSLAKITSAASGKAAAARPGAGARQGASQGQAAPRSGGIPTRWGRSGRIGPGQGIWSGEEFWEAIALWRPNPGYSEAAFGIGRTADAFGDFFLGQMGYLGAGFISFFGHGTGVIFWPAYSWAPGQDFVDTWHRAVHGAAMGSKQMGDAGFRAGSDRLIRSYVSPLTNPAPLVPAGTSIGPAE